MKKVFVQQPYFLPWLGFFAKLSKSDVYVVLDNANHRRNHLSRVQFLNSNSSLGWLKVPCGASQNSILSEIKLPSKTLYVECIINTLKCSYQHSEFFEEEFKFISNLIRGSLTKTNSNVAL